MSATVALVPITSGVRKLPMNLAFKTSPALDEFAGICAVGAMDSPALEAIPLDPYLLPKVSGIAYWDKTAYQIAMWAGDRDGGPGSAGDMRAWLRLGDETMDLAGPFEAKIAELVPASGLPTVMGAIAQASAMLNSANEFLEYVEDPIELAAAFEHLQEIAGSSKSALEYEGDALLAHTDILFNCMVDLLGNMTVVESQDVHLGFDVAAQTLDPETGNKVEVRAGWAKTEGTDDYVHSFELNGARCQAHDEAAFDRMMAAYPAASREHYRHTFTHLHQAAHAIGDYAAAKVGEAIAKAGTVDQPLLHVDRHALTHKVHADVVTELAPFVWKMTGEPGRGDHKH